VPFSLDWYLCFLFVYFGLVFITSCQCQVLGNISNRFLET
jgi:hypothetical protein